MRDQNGIINHTKLLDKAKMMKDRMNARKEQ